MINAVKKPHELLNADLQFLFGVAQHALAAGELVPAEEEQLRKSEALLRVFGSHLIAVLRGFEKDGRFSDALSLQAAFSGSIQNAASIGQFAATTESAKAWLKNEARADARAIKEANDAARADQERRVLRDYIGQRQIDKPSKFIESEKPNLDRAAEAANLKPPSRSTWNTRMGELGFTSSRRKFKT